jgi:hypothetical protein
MEGRRDGGMGREGVKGRDYSEGRVQVISSEAGSSFWVPEKRQLRKHNTLIMIM